MGAFLTVCGITRNKAEQRVRAMAQAGWKASPTPDLGPPDTDEDGKGVLTNLEDAARDQIARFIQAKFKGHGMARLVNAILAAQGYTTHLGDEGPDKGVDLVAGTGPMGFGSPRLCVQVKSGCLGTGFKWNL